MKNSTGNFFSTEEQQRIKRTVKNAEKCTSGEIVPMLTRCAYDYPRAEIIGGGFFALAAATTLSWGFFGESLWVFLAAFLLLYLPCKWLIRFCPPLKRSLISDREMAEEVAEKAMVSFVERQLHHTRDNTGILILICLFEHRVQILADRGINAVVPPHTWDHIVAELTAGIRQGQACDALCLAVQKCGELLAGHFPVREDDKDELPNLILE
ncbi:MAG: putative rane protein [Desulfuromonadales bacterium]|jgi:putative membrane protein|nr:putative rane protein [Desulfuromonadales bacterium]